MKKADRAISRGMVSRRHGRTIRRYPSCLISCTQSGPDGGLGARDGMQGSTKPSARTTSMVCHSRSRLPPNGRSVAKPRQPRPRDQALFPVGEFVVSAVARKLESDSGIRIGLTAVEVAVRIKLGQRARAHGVVAHQVVDADVGGSCSLGFRESGGCQDRSEGNRSGQNLHDHLLENII
jgi:hypothetical protein